MKSIQQIKDEYAREVCGYSNWQTLDFIQNIKNINVDDLMRRMAEEVKKEAAEVATVNLPSHTHLHGTKNVDKQSILNIEIK